MNRRWQRSVRLYDVPVMTRSFVVLCSLGVAACLLALYREIAGLGPSSGMNDAYAWGIWKTFNIMVLTGLGSGGFAVGLAVWVFGQRQLHAVMRTAVLSSFLTYASGLVLLGIDVGRPWNFFSILLPWRWNAHSPMLEIAFCMPFYTAVPLTVELVPLVLEWLSEHFPQLDFAFEAVESLVRQIYPFVLGLAFLLPAMHQSSLGALMLLAGTQVHPLWQTPLLPLLYVVAAVFMGFAFVTFILLVAHVAWNRPIDTAVVASLSRMTAWIIAAWMAMRTVDLALRGSLALALQRTQPAALFWIETITLSASAILAVASSRRRSPRIAFHASILACAGGMLYRFDPTTPVFRAAMHAHYFPSLIELAVAVGFVAIAVAAFCAAAKSFAVLPAPLETWFAGEQAREFARNRKDAARYVTGFAAAD